jgi:hypothetical protein
VGTGSLAHGRDEPVYVAAQGLGLRSV